MRRLIPVIAVLILIAGGFFGYRYYQAQQSLQALSGLQTTPAERGNLVASVGATGAVRANQTAILAWQVSGNIEQVSVQLGEPVKTGQVLARLKQNSLPQSIIMAKADLASARKSLNDLVNARVPLAKALQDYENAQQALNDLGKNTQLQQAQARDTLLKAQKVYTDSLTLQNNLEARTSSQNVSDAQENYDRAQAQVEQLRNLIESLPGTPQTNPEKAIRFVELKIARARRDQAKFILDLYGGQPTGTELERADANLQLAAAQLKDAEESWNRIKDGADPTTKMMLEAQLADARRTYESQKTGPDSNDVSALEARIAAAQSTLDMAEIKAPFAGTVTDSSGKPGDQVNPGKTSFRIDDLSHLLVDMNVSEVDINRIKVGQTVSMTFDAIQGKAYSGVVTVVDPVGTAIQGVVEFPVTIEITNPDADVKPGMTAAVNIVVNMLNNVLIVPNRAVRVVGGQRVVYILQDGKLATAKLTLGASSDTSSEVTAGDLKPGDEIVLNPPVVFETNGPPPFVRNNQ